MARILIADDHPAFRKQLRLLLESRSDWQVCCEAFDGRDVVEKHATSNPHLTVMDFNMPVLDGLTASRLILTKSTGAVILMVTVFTSRQLADEAMRAGIKGFCSKIDVACITEAVEALLDGKTYFSQLTH